MIIRAYSTLRIVKADGALRELVGIATTPSVDAAGDIVEPRGARFKLPIPALWGHDTSKPIGWVTAAKVTDAGIEATIKVAKIDEPGALKDRLDEVWQSCRAGLLRGLSIGFQPLESEPLRSGGRRFKSWAWRELSICALACNEEASITAVKHAMATPGAAAGRRRGVVYLHGRPGRLPVVFLNRGPR